MFWCFEQQKSDDKSKFGGLWVAHIQNYHQTQGLLKMDIVVEPQRTENATLYTQSISQAEIMFFQEDKCQWKDSMQKHPLQRRNSQPRGVFLMEPFSGG